MAETPGPITIAGFEGFGPKDMGWSEDEFAEEPAIDEKGERR